MRFPSYQCWGKCNINYYSGPFLYPALSQNTGGPFDNQHSSLQRPLKSFSVPAGTPGSLHPQSPAAQGQLSSSSSCCSPWHLKTVELGSPLLRNLANFHALPSSLFLLSHVQRWPLHLLSLRIFPPQALAFTRDRKPVCLQQFQLSTLQSLWGKEIQRAWQRQASKN